VCVCVCVSEGGPSCKRTQRGEVRRPISLRLCVCLSLPLSLSLSLSHAHSLRTIVVAEGLAVLDGDPLGHGTPRSHVIHTHVIGGGHLHGRRRRRRTHTRTLAGTGRHADVDRDTMARSHWQAQIHVGAARPRWCLYTGTHKAATWRPQDLATWMRSFACARPLSFHVCHWHTRHWHTCPVTRAQAVYGTEATAASDSIIHARCTPCTHTCSCTVLA
jgi:hypothetical protein